MDTRNVHIFCVSSVTAAFFAAVKARTSKSIGSDIYVCLDKIPMPTDQHHYIIKTIELIEGCKIVDLSNSVLDPEFKVPSTRKHLTRKLKTKPGLKQIYGFFYQFAKAKRTKHIHDLLKLKLREINKSAHIYTQPKLVMTDAIAFLLPEAKLHYIEHGLGDYIDLVNKDGDQSDFLCLFSEEWNEYNKSKTRPLFDIESFQSIISDMTALYPEVPILVKSRLHGYNIHLVCLQSFEQFKIPIEYWQNYLDLVVEKMDPSEKNILLIKPHHFQSERTLATIKQYLKTINKAYFVLEEGRISALSIEIIYAFIKDQVKSVHSPFSSSVFYISKLYPTGSTNFYYDFHLIREFQSNVPELYIDRWNQLENLVIHVFGKHCKPLIEVS